MASGKVIHMTKHSDPRLCAREIVSFLDGKPGRALIVSAPLLVGKTELALRSAYKMAEERRVLYLSTEVHPSVLVNRLTDKCGLNQVSCRDLLFARIEGRPFEDVCMLISDTMNHIAARQSFDGICTLVSPKNHSIAVIDSLNQFGIELSDLVKLAQDLNISILATCAIE